MEFNDAIITLVVKQGDNNTGVLKVHQGVLCKSSKFLQNALKPEWANSRADPHTIDFSDDDAKTVNDYIRWLYTDKIPFEDRIPADRSPEEKQNAARQAYARLVKAYVFGEKMVDVRYKNQVLEGILAVKRDFNVCLSVAHVRIVYDGTSSQSPLRRWIAESVALAAFDDSGSEGAWQTYIDGCPKEALADALKATIRLREAVPKSSGDDPKRFLEAE